MSVRVKICGLTRPEDARLAAEAGADYLGLVFAEGSPRRVRAAEVEQWLDEVRGLAEVVGVFRDNSLEEVLAVTELLDLDLVQLHGRESGQEWSRLPVRMVEARVVTGDGVPAARWPGGAWAHLLDGGAGSGRSFDWQMASEIARAERLFLAGGLHPGNVADAIEQVQPFAVDVSSGVEASPGRKDATKVLDFIAAAKETDPA